MQYSYPMPPPPPYPPPPPPMQYIPPPIAYSPKPYPKTGLQKYGGLIWAGVFIVGGIILGVLAGLTYGKYHKETNKKSTTAKNTLTYLIAFAASGGVLLIIGLIIAFVSIKKLKQ